MKNYTTLSYLVKREICKFSEKISKKLKRPERKLVTNMLYGLSESQSCHLSKIARALKEDITLKKTIDRLSMGLKSFDGNDELLEQYVEVVKSYIDDRTIFAIDGSDITKPCSSKKSI